MSHNVTISLQLAALHFLLETASFIIFFFAYLVLSGFHNQSCTMILTAFLLGVVVSEGLCFVGVGFSGVLVGRAGSGNIK